MRSTWASTGCTMARRCGRSWYSDVMPFEYMKAMAKLWSSAIEISQTIGRNMQAGESQNPVVAQLLGKIFDPRAWFSGTDGMDQALQQMAEGPRLADVWDTERKMLTLFNA